jgi:hypothetical protein
MLQRGWGEKGEGGRERGRLTWTSPSAVGSRKEWGQMNRRVVTEGDNARACAKDSERRRIF